MTKKSLNLSVIGFLLTVLMISNSWGQEKVLSGSVLDQYFQPLAYVNVAVVGSQQGTITDGNGKFRLVVDKKPPFQIRLTSLGYETKTLKIREGSQELKIILVEAENLLQAVVVSASRRPERIIKAAGEIYSLGSKDLKKATGSSFFEALVAVPSVEMAPVSRSISLPNSRGFTASQNPRFITNVDGVSNLFPALGFPLGNLIGATDLDVHSIEWRPGASSALYGANAFNGFLAIKTKNPFDYTGLSLRMQSGITSQQAAGVNPYIDFGFRFAQAVSENFAFKINMQYFKGTEWLAGDDQNIQNPGLDRNSDPIYDGLNIYGDENSRFLSSIGEAISRTGYKEINLVNPETWNLKSSIDLHLRPFGDDVEFIGGFKMTEGSAIFQGANRYAIPGFRFYQARLEIKNKKGFIRAYHNGVGENPTYDTRMSANHINQAWKSDEQWFTDYQNTFLSNIGPDPSDLIARQQAHRLAREFADTGRFLPGTADFQQAFEKTISSKDPEIGGSRLADASTSAHIEGNYDIGSWIDKYFSLQIGGVYNDFTLRSEGTVFTDLNNPINYSEFGAYAQVQKEIFNNRLKLTGSIRYDKNELFEGNLSKRLSGVLSLNNEASHVLRASYQTGFRNPTPQDLFLRFRPSTTSLALGTAPGNLERELSTYTLSAVAGGGEVALSGIDALNRAYTLGSVTNFFNQIDSVGEADFNLLEKFALDPVQSEKIEVYEIGYRALFKKNSFELGGYYNRYTDFIYFTPAIVPLYGNIQDGSIANAFFTNDTRLYSFTTNFDQTVRSYGATVDFNSQINKFNLRINYNYNKLIDEIFLGFNTPEHRIKMSFGGEKLWKNFGFNTNFRYATGFQWVGDFGTANVPAFGVLDAQVNYYLKNLKSRIKIGGTNLTGGDYFSAPGAGQIGSTVFIQFTYEH